MPPIPTVATERLLLRAFRPADWDSLAALNADPKVRDWLGGNTLSRHETWAQMESLLGQWLLRGYGLFAVEHRGVMIGRVGILHPIDAVEPELAWTIAADSWGQGFATEAARHARDWAFQTFGWTRLVSYIVPNNGRSRRVAEKLGAVTDGKIDRRGLLHDVWVHPTRATTITV
jgi:RimJ/RimL family protein N-acetyltransferase